MEAGINIQISAGKSILCLKFTLKSHSSYGDALNLIDDSSTTKLTLRGFRVLHLNNEKIIFKDTVITNKKAFLAGSFEEC